MELLPYNEQASRKLLSVGSIVADQESLLTLRDNEIGDIHHSEMDSGVNEVATICGCISE